LTAKASRKPDEGFELFMDRERAFSKHNSDHHRARSECIANSVQSSRRAGTKPISNQALRRSTLTAANW